MKRPVTKTQRHDQETRQQNTPAGPAHIPGPAPARRDAAGPASPQPGQAFRRSRRQAEQPPRARPLPCLWQASFLSGAALYPWSSEGPHRLGRSRSTSCPGPKARGAGYGARGACPGLLLRPPRTHLPRQPSQGAQGAARHLRGRRVGADVRCVAVGLQRAGRGRHDTGRAATAAAFPTSLSDDDTLRWPWPLSPPPELIDSRDSQSRAALSRPALRDGSGLAWGCQVTGPGGGRRAARWAAEYGCPTPTPRSRGSGPGLSRQPEAWLALPGPARLPRPLGFPAVVLCRTRSRSTCLSSLASSSVFQARGSSLPSPSKLPPQTSLGTLELFSTQVRCSPQAKQHLSGHSHSVCWSRDVGPLLCAALAPVVPPGWDPKLQQLLWGIFTL